MDAKGKCEENYAELAAPKSQQEFESIFKFIRKKYTTLNAMLFWLDMTFEHDVCIIKTFNYYLNL